MSFKKSIRSTFLSLVLLFALRKKRGESVTSSRRGTLQRIVSYNLLKRERIRRERFLRAASERRPRRWHVRPIFRDRKVHGAWYSLISTMKQSDHEAFYKFMRMTPDCFDWLLKKVRPVIKKTSNREPISAGQRLALTLRFLASGDSMISLSYLFRASNQVISNIVFETTAAIWYVLKPEVFEPMTEEFWRRKSAEFESMWQFPMCLGAIDGKHVFVQKFPSRGSEHYNYKYGHSLILFAVADAKYKFSIVDVGSRGRESDGGVFERSEFGNLFLSHELRLPPSAYNSDVNAYLPYVFLGDDAFTFGPHLMKPFDFNMAGKPEELIFNYRLSRARRVVENAFGIMAARFRVLRTHINGSETLVQNVILACCALHNLHLLREDSIPPKQRVYMPPGYADVYKTNGKLKEGRWRTEDKDAEASIFHSLSQREAGVDEVGADEVRERFLELFIRRSLPWQFDVLPGR